MCSTRHLEHLGQCLSTAGSIIIVRWCRLLIPMISYDSNCSLPMVNHYQLDLPLLSIPNPCLSTSCGSSMGSELHDHVFFRWWVPSPRRVAPLGWRMAPGPLAGWMPSSHRDVGTAARISNPQRSAGRLGALGVLRVELEWWLHLLDTKCLIDLDSQQSEGI